MRKHGWAVSLLAVGLACSVSGCQKQDIAVTQGAGMGTAETEVIETETGSEVVSETDRETGARVPGKEETGSFVSEEPLTEPPEIGLTDALSSTLNSFTAISGNYSWNSEADNLWAGEELKSVVACGIHPLELDETKAEKLHVPAYNQMDGTAYMVSCPVMPDQIVLTRWDGADLGKAGSPAKETVTYEDSSLIQLEAGMVYELKAVWEKEELDNRGFFGEADYVFLTDGNSAAKGNNDQQQVIVEKKEKDAESLEHMALYASFPFVYEEKEWELQTLMQEDMLIDGELAMDDRGHFLIRAVSGEDSYLLFDETVQLGMPAADVWIDEHEKLHIVLRDVRTARYRVTDFIYDSEKGVFLGSHVLNGDGINYLGTVEK